MLSNRARLSAVIVGAAACFACCNSSKDKKMNAIDYFQDPQAIALANAVAKDDVARIRQLAQEGAPVNARGAQGMTLPVWAIGYQKKNALRALLELGADPNARDEKNYPLLELAMESPDQDYLRLLLSANANLNVQSHDNEPLLFAAITKRNWPLVKMLIEKGADMNARGHNGATPMMYLALLNEYELISWMLDRGADALVLDNQGADLAWRVQRANIDPAHPVAAWRERVRVQLEQRGVRFPVAPPWERKKQEQKP